MRALWCVQLPHKREAEVLCDILRQILRADVEAVERVLQLLKDALPYTSIC